MRHKQLWNKNIMKLPNLACALFFVFFLALQQSFGLGVRGNFSGNNDYLLINDAGEVSLLSSSLNIPANNLSNTGSVIGSIELQNNEKIISEIYHKIIGTENVVFFITKSPIATNLVAFNVEANFSISTPTKFVLNPVEGIAYTGQYLYLLFEDEITITNLGTLNLTSDLNIRTTVSGVVNDFSEVFSLSPVINNNEDFTVSYNDGSIDLVDKAGSSFTTSALVSAFTNNALTFNLKPVVYQNGPDVFVLSQNSNLELLEGNTGNWNLLNSNIGALEATYFFESGQEALLQKNNGELLKINLTNGDILFSYHSYLYNAKEVNKENQIISGSDWKDFAISPAGYQKLENSNNIFSVWGNFHHHGTVDNSSANVTPAYYSTVLNGNSVEYSISWIAAGEGDASLDLNILDDQDNIIQELANDRPLKFGADHVNWDGILTSSSTLIGEGIYKAKFEFSSKINNVSETTEVFKRFVVDNSMPTFDTPSFSASLHNGQTEIIDNGAFLKVSDNQKLTIDINNIADPPVALDTTVYAVIELTNTLTNRKYEFLQQTHPVDNPGRNIQFVLDGNDKGGVRLPDGDYSFNLVLKDEAGNSSTAITSFDVDSKNYSGVFVKSSNVRINANLLDYLLDESNLYRANVHFEIFGNGNEELEVSVYMESVADPQIKKYLVAMDNSKFENTEIQLNANGEYFNDLGFDFSTNERRNINGKHTIFIEVKDSQGGVATYELVFVMNQMEVVITAPADGENVGGQVAVRGIAVSPSIGQEGDFKYYRAYYVEGTPTIPTGLTSISDLHQLTEWKPMTVPLANQSPSVINSVISTSIYDSGFPESNVGARSLSSEGLLAYFKPDASDNTTYTLLVVAEEDVLVGGISYDYVVVNYNHDNNDDGNIALNVNPVNESAVVVGGEDVLDLTDDEPLNDDLEYNVEVPDFKANISVAIYEGRGSESGNQVFIRDLYQDGDNGINFTFDGNGFDGQPLSSGEYTLFVTSYLENEVVLLQKSRNLRLVMKDFSDEDAVIQISPNPLSLAFQDIITPNVVFSINFEQVVPVKMEVFNGQDLVHTFRENISLEKADFVWDFQLEDGTSYLDNLTQDEVILTLKVSHTDTENPPWESLTKDFKIINENTFLPETDVISSGGEDDSWLTSVKADFKFRAIPRATLHYHPIRKIDYSPRVAEGSKQTIRRFLPINFNLDYAKFYNSLELEGFSWHRVKTRYSGVFSDGGNKYVNSTSDREFSSYYAIRDWSSYWNNPDLNDTYLNIPPRLAVNVNSGGNILEYFGDSTYYNDNDISNKKHFCSPEEVSLGYEKASTGDDKYGFCSTIARTKRMRLPDGPGDDRWKGMVNGEITLFIKKDNQPNDPSQELDQEEVDRSAKGRMVYRLHLTTNDGSFDKLNALGESEKALGFSFAEHLFAFDTNNAEYRDDFPGNYYEYRYREKSGGFGQNASHTYKFRASGNRENDYKHQRGYTNRPKLDWMSPYLMLEKNTGEQVINYDQQQSLTITGDRKGYQFADPFGWDETNNTGAICETKYFTTGDNGDTQGFEFCSNDLGGTKTGQRGFAYKANVSNMIANHAGELIGPDEYFTNYWKRDDTEDAFVRWERETSGEPRKDDLVFRPIINVDLIERLMGVTWDTITVNYPFSKSTVPILEKEVPGNVASRVKAFYPEEGVTYFPYSETPANYLTLENQEVFPDDAGPTYLDEEELDLTTQFASVLSATDKSNPGQLVHYIVDEYLKFHVDIRPFFVQDDGTLKLEEAAIDEFFDVEIISTGEGASRDIKAKVKLKNVPKVLSQWNGSFDTRYSETQGYIYNTQTFNANAFQSQGFALNNGGTNPGFYSLSGYAAGELTTPLPSSVKVFHRSADNPEQIILNPNIKASEGDFRWDINLYHYDGEEVNKDLSIVNKSDANFTLGLNIETTPKNFVDLRGVIPSEMTFESLPLTFKQYEVLYVDEIRNEDSELTKTISQIKVNKFYRTEGANPYIGTVLPDVSKDLWDNTSDTDPVLAYWDVTRKNGPYDVYVKVTYEDANANKYILLDKVEAIVRSQTIASENYREIFSPYKRANILMPNGVDDDAHLSIYPVAASDIVNDGNPSASNDLAPIGPVMEIRTTGARSFEGTLPTLSYIFSAREVFQKNKSVIQGLNPVDYGLPVGTDISDIDAQNGNNEFVLTHNTIIDIMTNVTSMYKIYVLAASGEIEALETLCETSDNPERERVSLICKASLREISTGNANVPHYGRAMVMLGDIYGNIKPRINTFENNNGFVNISGDYVYGFEGDEIIYGEGNVPDNLKLYVTPYPSIIEGVNLGEIYSPVDPILISGNGSFNINLNHQVLFPGTNYFFLKYDDAILSTKFKLELPPGVLFTSDWSMQSPQFNADCGIDGSIVSFKANKQGEFNRIISNEHGTILGSETLAYNRGVNTYPWDGCLLGQELPDGQYYQEFVFVGDDEKNYNSYLNYIGDIPTTSANIVNVSVLHDKFIPSPAVSQHKQVITVEAENAERHNISVVIVRNSDDVSITLNEELKTIDANTFRLNWDGLNSGVAQEAGLYTVYATVKGSRSYKMAQFEIVEQAYTPVVNITLEPNQLVYPEVNGTIKVETDFPLGIQLAAMNTTGASPIIVKNIKGNLDEQEYFSIDKGVTKVEFNVEDFLINGLPNQIKLNYITMQGAVGTISVGLTIQVANIEVTNIVPGPTEFSPDILPEYYPLFEEAPVQYWSMGFEANRSGEGFLRVKGSNGQILLDKAFEITQGYNSIAWDGTNEYDVFLPEDDYTIEIYGRLPYTHAETLELVASAVTLNRISDIIISYENDNRYLPGIENHNDFVQSIVASLSALGITDVDVMDAEETSAYMQYKPDGAIVFAYEVFPNKLYGGTRQSSVVNFVKGGGSAIFVKGYPLYKYLDAGGTERTSWNGFVSLLGFAESGASENALFDQYGSLGLTTSSINPLLEDNLSYVYQNGSTVAFNGLGLQTEAFEYTDAVLEPLVYDEENQTGATMSYYLKPVFGNIHPSITGRFLSVYPFDGTLTASNHSLVADDVAGLAQRYLLSNDLVFNKEDLVLSITNRDSEDLEEKYVDVFGDGRLNMLQVKSTNFMRIDGSISYFGDTPLNQVVLRINAPDIEEFVPIEIPFDNVVPNSTLPFTIEKFRIGSKAKKEDNRLEFEIVPFSYQEEENAQVVTRNEINTINNFYRARFWVINTTDPKLKIDNTVDDDENGIFEFEVLYSNHPSSGQFLVNCTHKTNISIGDLKVDVSLLDDTENELYSNSFSVENTQRTTAEQNTQFRFFIPNVDGVTEGVVHSVKVKVTDQLDQVIEDQAFFNVDNTPPTINEFVVSNPQYTDSREYTDEFGTVIRTDYHYSLTVAPSVVIDIADNQGLGKYVINNNTTGAEAFKFFEGDLSSRETLVLDQLDSGVSTLTARDLAGNEANAYFSVSRDIYPPELHVYTVEQTILDYILAGQPADISLIGYNYLEKMPWFDHNYAANFVRNSDGAIIETNYEYPVHTKHVKYHRFSTELNLKQNLKGYILDLVAFDGSDLKTYEMKLDGVEVNHEMYNPYLNSSNEKYLSDPDLRTAMLSNNRQRLIHIPDNGVLQVLTIRLVDQQDNESNFVINLGTPLEQIEYEDAKDRDGNTGIDYGKIYATKNDASGSYWLYFLIQSLESNYSHIGMNNFIYLDIDGNPETGIQSSAFAPVPGSEDNFKGFEYRVQLKTIDQDQADLNSSFVLQKWQNASWATVTTVNGSVQDDEDLIVDVNQKHAIFKQGKGEGHQVMPDNSLGLANGGTIELGVKIPVLAGNKVRWFIHGEQDKVYDEANNTPYEFRVDKNTPIHVDAKTSDWYERDAEPAHSLMENIITDVSVGSQNTQLQTINLSVRNNGYTGYDNLTFRYFLDLVSCPDLKVYPTSFFPGNWVLKGYTTEKQSALPGEDNGELTTMKYIEISLKDINLTAGGEIIDVPLFYLEGGAGCEDDLLNNLNGNQLENYQLLNGNDIIDGSSIPVERSDS